MIDAKIRLSATEMNLVTNAEWILTKNGIMEKARLLLEGLQQDMVSYLVSKSDVVTVQKMYGTPKISKGENYQGLPYLILDYPRIFHKEHTLAIRTLFWWGRFFSITLHVAGDHKQQAEENLLLHFNEFRDKEFFIGVNDDPWEHHFEIANYSPISTMRENDFKKIIEEKSFVKIAGKITLQQWEDAGKILFDDFKRLITVIINFQAGEKVL